MTAPLLSSDHTALGNPHFYYSRGVGGDDIAIMRDRNYVKPTTGQLWQREAERDAQTGLNAPAMETLAILAGVPAYGILGYRGAQAINAPWASRGKLPRLGSYIGR